MASAQRGNGYDQKLTTQFVSDIERQFTQLDSLRSEHMLECKSVRETIADYYDRAKDAGIPKRELKAVIKARALERRAQEARDALEGDERETFDQIRMALGDLGDLPLGQAVLKEANGEERIADNVAALNRGIKQKPVGMPGSAA